MAQVPRELTPFESNLHFFGAELRHWRILRGLSQQRLGALTFNSGSNIGKVETAARRPTLPFARCLDTVLESGGVFERLLVLVDKGNDAKPGAPAAPGDADIPGGEDLGLVWSRDPADTVEVATGLWRADMQRRTVIKAAWSAAALAQPLGRWLLDPVDPDAAHTGSRRVGQADVAALWSMCAAFADADHQLGGGYARATLVHYVDQVVAPLLAGRYTDEIGRTLFAAAARLCDVAGFMCFDSGSPGLAQRYYVQALRMAKISGDSALGANILADMSMQAHHQRHPSQAVALAEAAIQTASRVSPSTLARCHAMRARALALQGDAVASDHALNRAEQVLSDARPADEPFWIRFFTNQQLATEAMYAASDLAQSARVRRNAPYALAPATEMQRRHVLATATLAASHLPAADQPHGLSTDVEQACHVLGSVCSVLGSLTSARSLDSINRVRIRLNVYANHPAVRQFEDEFQSAVAA